MPARRQFSSTDPDAYLDQLVNLGCKRPFLLQKAILLLYWCGVDARLDSSKRPQTLLLRPLSKATELPISVNVLQYGKRVQDRFSTYELRKLVNDVVRIRDAQFALSKELKKLANTPAAKECKLDLRGPNFRISHLVSELQRVRRYVERRRTHPKVERLLGEICKHVCEKTKGKWHDHLVSGWLGSYSLANNKVIIPHTENASALKTWRSRAIKNKHECGAESVTKSSK